MEVLKRGPKRSMLGVRGFSEGGRGEKRIRHMLPMRAGPKARFIRRGKNTDLLIL